MDEENEDDRLFEDDYYGFLNINKNATQEEITDSYRRLSRIYHPDKHLDPAAKKEAEILFHKTKRAYEVLSDPRQRAIYDCVGEKGLQTDGWEVVQRTRTAQEIREEFERLERIRQQRQLDQRTNPKLHFTVNVNATELFPAYESDYDDIDVEELPSVEISGVSCVGSVEAPFTTRDVATISGSVNTHNGTGQGTVNLSLRHITSEKGWVECSAGAGQGPNFTFKAFRTLSKRLYGTAICMFHGTPSGIRPGLITSLGWQLDKGTVGDVTWRAGGQSSMAVSLHSNNGTSTRGATVLLGIPHSYISLNYSRKFSEDADAVRLRLALKAGTFGAVLEYGAEKKVSKQSTISAAVMMGVPTGVTLKLKISRGNQTYSFPILLCEELMPSPILYATVTPMVAWVLLNRFVIEPFQRNQKNRKKEKQKEANKARLAELRREANSAKELMKAAFSRIRAEEEIKRGLVVVRALYGNVAQADNATPNPAASGSGDEQDLEVVDVTVPLQVLVKDSKLFLHETSKSQLPGFYDPCVGDEKWLMVQYLFHNHLHQVTIEDTEPLRLPKSSHRVSAT